MAKLLHLPARVNRAMLTSRTLTHWSGHAIISVIRFSIVLLGEGQFFNCPNVFPVEFIWDWTCRSKAFMVCRMWHLCFRLYYSPSLSLIKTVALPYTDYQEGWTCSIFIVRCRSLFLSPIASEILIIYQM